jgi:hypothetical protein
MSTCKETLRRKLQMFTLQTYTTFRGASAADPVYLILLRWAGRFPPEE